jgi:hypothetical protein
MSRVNLMNMIVPLWKPVPPPASPKSAAKRPTTPKPMTQAALSKKLYGNPALTITVGLFLFISIN